MNERIKELEKQCWNHQTNHLDTKKFAELIVKECAQKLENDGMVEVAMEIKDHFGIEQ